MGEEGWQEFIQYRGDEGGGFMPNRHEGQATSRWKSEGTAIVKTAKGERTPKR